MGNTRIISKPGDIIIFKSTNLHKAGDIEVFENNERRVLQYFHVFFDKKEQDIFYKNHKFCDHMNAITTMKYLTYFFDIKFFPEYFNMARIFNENNCDTMYSTHLINDAHVATIHGIKYFNYF